jgi:hypothetical protein
VRFGLSPSIRKRAPRALPQDLGFDRFQFGVIRTATHLGSAHSLSSPASVRTIGARSVLLAACGLMAFTGIGFSVVTRSGRFVIVGFIGTLNPSGR